MGRSKLVDLQSVTKAYDVKMLVVDGSVPKYLAEKWVSQAQTLNIPYYNIGEGALEERDIYE